MSLSGIFKSNPPLFEYVVSASVVVVCNVRVLSFNWNLERELIESQKRYENETAG